MTTADLLENQGITRKTFERYRVTLLAAGLPLVAETRGREKVWRILPDAHRNVIRLRQAQAVALLVQKHATTFLRGTMFDELLEDVYAQAEATLTQSHLHQVRDFDRKVFDRNDEAIRDDGARAEHVNELVSALLYNHRLDATYRGRAAPFVLDPYTLLIYRKGLYVMGFNHTHKALRTYALDRFESLSRRIGDAFDYPSDYSPSAALGGAFGIAGDDAPTRVRIRFYGAYAIEAVSRREHHPSQRWETDAPMTDGSRVLTLDVSVNDLALDLFLLGHGDAAEVLEPALLADRIRLRAEGIVARYAASGTTVPSARA